MHVNSKIDLVINMKLFRYTLIVAITFCNKYKYKQTYIRSCDTLGIERYELRRVQDSKV